MATDTLDSSQLSPETFQSLPFQSIPIPPCSVCDRTTVGAPQYPATGGRTDGLPDLGEVWAIKESLFLPVVRHLDIHLPPDINLDTATSVRKSLKSFMEGHVMRDQPRACVIEEVTRDRGLPLCRVYLLGTLNEGNLAGYPTLMSLFTAEVDKCGPRLPEHHIHSVPAIRNYVIAIPFQPKPGIYDDKGHVVGRWVRRRDQATFKCHPDQVRRLRYIFIARNRYWLGLPAEEQDDYLTQFQVRVSIRLTSHALIFSCSRILSAKRSEK